MKKKYEKPFCEIVRLNLHSGLASDPELGNGSVGGNQENARARSNFWDDTEDPWGSEEGYDDEPEPYWP